MVSQTFQMPRLSNMSSTAILDLQKQQPCQFPVSAHLHTRTPFSQSLFLNGTTCLLRYVNVLMSLHSSITYLNMSFNYCYLLLLLLLLLLFWMHFILATAIMYPCIYIIMQNLLLQKKKKQQREVERAIISRGNLHISVWYNHLCSSHT